MNGIASNVLPSIIQATIGLSVTAVACLVILKLFQPKSILIHRTAWVLVAAQGILFVRMSLPMPVLEPASEIAPDEFASVVHPGELDSDRIMPERSAPDLGPANHEIDAQTAETLLIVADKNGAAGDLRSARRAMALADTRSPGRFLSDGSTLIAALWLTGAGAFAAYVLFNYLCLMLSVRNCAMASGRWRNQWEQLLNRRRVTQTIPMITHPRLGPFLCRLPTGYRLVIPLRFWREISDDQRESILEHELAHFRRGDIWKSAAVRLILLPHWFNPLAWMAARKFDEGGEWACDQAVALRRKNHIPDFARALLTMSESQSEIAVGTSAFRGSSVSTRIKRILTINSRAESRGKRALIVAGLLVAFLVGSSNIELVQKTTAQESESDQTANDPSNEQDIADRISELASRITNPGQGDPLVDRFIKTIQTRPGQIAVTHHVGLVEQQMRSEAVDRAIPEFFDRRFEKRGEQYFLRDDQTEFAEELLDRTADFNQDVATVEPVMQTIAESITGDDEADLMLKKLFQHPSAPAILYLRQLRTAMRPTNRQVRQRLGRVFAPDPAGQLHVREQYHPQVQRLVDTIGRAEQALEIVRDELTTVAGEIDRGDEESRQAADLFADPHFHFYVSFQLGGNAESSIDEQIRKGLENIEKSFEDTSSGLVLKAEDRSQLDRWLGQIPQLKHKAAILRGPYEEFANDINEQHGDLEKELKRLLTTELGLVALASQSDIKIGDARELIDKMAAQVLEPAPDGGMRVIEARREDAVKFVREQMQQIRRMRRRSSTGRKVVPLIEDDSIREALTNIGGRVIAGEMVSREIAERKFDSFAKWRDAHFRSVAGGYVANDESSPMLLSIVKMAEDMTREMEKDDF